MSRHSEGKSTRIGVTLSGEAAEAFNKEIKRTLATNSAFARLLIIEGLERRGHKIEDDVTWGGYRGTSEDAEVGQLVGAGAP